MGEVISFEHERLGQLHITSEDVARVTMEAATLLRGPGVARNIMAACTDAEGVAHPFMIGGVDVSIPEGQAPSVVFWSWPETTHSRLIEQAGDDARISFLIGHTHENIATLRLKDLSVRRVPGLIDDDNEYLRRLNAARALHGIDDRESAQFAGSTPKALYVATLLAPENATIPVQAHQLGPDGQLIWRADVQYPVSFSDLRTCIGQIGLENA